MELLATQYTCCPKSLSADVRWDTLYLTCNVNSDENDLDDLRSFPYL